MKKTLTILVVLCFFMPGNGIFADEPEKIQFDFEESLEKWKIPDWAYYQRDHKARAVQLSSEEASKGENSLEIMCDFPGDEWAAALVDVKKDFDMSKHKTISADVYLPRKAPRGLIQARLILTVGEGWLFTEMKNPIPLKRGKWVTVTARLDSPVAEETGTTDWKGRGEKRLLHHIDKVKKIAVRIEYDAAPPYRMGSRYHGPVYVDNIVVE